MSVARFDGVVPLLLHCVNAFEVQRKCGLELSLVVFRIACPRNTHTRTHRSTVAWLSQNEDLDVRLLIYHGCHNVKC